MKRGRGPRDSKNQPLIRHQRDSKLVKRPSQTGFLLGLKKSRRPNDAMSFWAGDRPL